MFKSVISDTFFYYRRDSLYFEEGKLMTKDNGYIKNRTEQNKDTLLFGPSNHEFPQLISKGILFFPDSLKEINLTGELILERIIDLSGNPDSIKIFKSTNDRLNEVAINYIKNWKFIPGKLNGKPSVYRMRIPLKF